MVYRIVSIVMHTVAVGLVVSSVALAAVHMGVLKQGQTGIVRVKVVASPAAFEGSTRNGVSSSPYGPYAGAFKIIK